MLDGFVITSCKSLRIQAVPQPAAPPHRSSPARTGVAVEAGPLGGELVRDESENHPMSARRNGQVLVFTAAAVAVPLVFIAAPTRAVADGGVPTEAPAAYDAGDGSGGSGASTVRVDGGIPGGPTIRTGPVDSGEGEQMSRLLLYALGIVVFGFILPVQIVKAEVSRRRRRQQPVFPAVATPRPRKPGRWPRPAPSQPADGPTTGE